MEVSAATHPSALGAQAKSPLLRARSDERLVTLVRRGNQGAFETLVGRYESRLLAFCRHMLASKEDAEDVLQEVFAAAYNAMLADDRPINVRPWLYRIARNRSLNHLRKATAIGVDSMDVHLSEHGLSTADRVHRREEFRQLLSDVQELPETQRTALLLREIDALSYEQIAEVMETTVPSVKSLLVRARVSLAEAAEARLLSCEEVREELGQVAEGLARTTAPVRRHLRTCDRCQGFRKQLRETNKALAMIFPVGPLLLFKKLVLAHLGTASAAGGSGTAGAGAGAGAAAGGALQAGATAIATKAAAGLAAAAIVTAGAVEVNHTRDRKPVTASKRSSKPVAATPPAAATPQAVASAPQPVTPAGAPAPAVKPDRPNPGVTREPPEPAPTSATDPVKPAPETPVTAAPGPSATTAPGAPPTAALAPSPTPTVQHESDSTTLPSETTAQTKPTGAVGPTPTPGPKPTPTPPPTPPPPPAATPAPQVSPAPAPTSSGDEEQRTTAAPATPSG